MQHDCFWLVDHSLAHVMSQPKLIRRARVMEDGEWRLIKPGQEWDDGEVRTGSGGSSRSGSVIRWGFEPWPMDCHRPS